MVISVLFGAAISLASSAAAAISGALAMVLPKVITVLGNPENLRALGNAISLVARVFEAFRPNESVEGMGDRALQGAEAGIRLRDLELKPDLSTRFSSEEKNAAGLAVAVRALEEKFKLPDGAMAGLPWLMATNPAYFDAGRIEALLRVTKDVASIVDYLDGKLGRADREHVEGTLVRAGSDLQPEKTVEQLRADLAAALERAAQQGRT